MHDRRSSDRRETMRRIRQAHAKLFLGIAVLVLFPVVGSAANDLAQISGRVRDASGIPVVGALVVVAAASPIIPERMALTDKTGAFAVMNLFAGQYSVKVTMPRFLPAMKQGIQLNSGGAAVLTVNLQNAMDVVRRAISREKDAQSEDIVWTLRSSRSTQPVLRLADTTKETPKFTSPDYTGYFQVYSKSVETSTGTTEGVGSQFSVTMPIDPTSKVTVNGQYTDLPTQPRGFGATYEFIPADRHRAAVGLNVRQGALYADPLHTGSSKEVQLKYGEDFQWSDHIVFNYGAEVGRAGALSTYNYLRPRFGIAWVPASRTTISISASSQAPAAADDPVRGKEYFDRTLYVPPAMERYAHGEVAFTHILTENVEVSAAAFRDRIETQALFVNTPDGRHGVLFLDTSNSPSEGVRVSVNRHFRKNIEASLGYTSVTGVGLDNRAASIDDVKNRLMRRRFQVVSARFKADLDTTQTQITAIYRWTNAFAASRLDPYQRLMEYNDPTLSLSIAQNLPTGRMFPGKVQAIIDARNLLDQSFGPQRTQLSQYPRLVKGGINIKF
jgi:hypothetical protein